jgi:N-acetylated-alpha-linked acidic dipeptidase
LNFAALENAADALTRSAQHYEKALAKARQNGEWVAGPASLQNVNAKLLLSERRLTAPEGLPRRPWYQHLIYAPGAYTGYGVKTIPGVREAIEQRNWKEAGEEIVRVAKVLEQEARLIDSARAELEQARQ